jgi:hypothetical protein
MPTDPRAPLDADGHVLAAVDDDRRTAVVLRLSRRAGLASIQIVVLRADDAPIVLTEAGVPTASGRWEFRSSGLWVEAVCERPDRHWSYGLECFALAIDRPDELLERGYGDRIPLGWELDFEADGGPSAGPGAPLSVGRVDGLLLTGPGPEGQHELAGPAVRGSWGGAATTEPDAWSLGLPAPVGPPIEVVVPLDPADAAGGLWSVGHDGRRLTARSIAGRQG